MTEVLVSIRPDAEQYGVAYLRTPSRVCRIEHLSFPHMVEFIRSIPQSKDNLFLVLQDTPRMKELADFYGAPHYEMKPLPKHWNGRNGEITHTELHLFTRLKEKHSTLPQRQALLNAWIYAGYPIKVFSRTKLRRLKNNRRGNLTPNTLIT